MTHAVSLDDKYALNTTRAYMTGIEALVRLPMLQQQRDQQRGLNTAGFVSGYRGSPLGGVDQAMWQAKTHLDRHHIVFQPGINEDLAATAVWGSQQVNLFSGANYDGVFGMWYGKGPGVDRSMDVIRHANAFGTSKFGGVLAVAGDDHAAKSSTLPHQSEHMFIGASIPILNPANVQEVLDLGIYGWELSRYCGTWVALKAITENMDSAISAEIDPARISIVIPENFVLPEDGVHARWPDTALAQEERLNKYKIYAAREFARANKLNKTVIDSDRPRLGIITTGKAYLDVMQALEDLGIDHRKAAGIGLRVHKVGMSWPLCPSTTHEFAEGLEEILVVEEKRSIIEDQLTGQLYNWPVEKRPRVIGEFDEQGHDLLTNLSELTPAMVARAIAARISRYYQDEQIDQRLSFYTQKERVLSGAADLPVRKPHYCSGCPHSTSTRIPEGSRALGGIGCHYMGIWEEGDRRAETFTQMGGEGATWIGQAPFTKTRHVFQNLGDGTYFHSGLLAIRQALAADINITYKILYNDAVAMTGGQPVDGNLSVERMIMQLRGEGVERIALVSDEPEEYAQLPTLAGLTTDHRDNLIAVEKELRDTRGTTVLIYAQTCAAEKRRRRRKGTLAEPARRVVINPEVCEGCGDCGVQSNCLSVIPLETELGRKRQIDQNACNKDYSCLQGFCPSFVTVEGDMLSQTTNTPLPSRLLPEPQLPSIETQPWNTVVTGVGGTGVLTIASLLAMAAHIEGKGCATMNQTGLAQKFGAVVSHVRIGKTQGAINAVRIAAGDADLLLGCDLVVAAADEAIAKVHKERSNAVVNHHAATTAEFIADPDADLPTAAMKALIASEVGECCFVDATGIATALLGDSIASNLFLLGFAYQKGFVPVSRSALEQAIELNGVAVDFNLSAFNWGRHAAVDPDAVRVSAAVDEPFRPLEDLNEIISDRVERLKAYQSASYASHFETVIRKLEQIEQGKTPGGNFDFTREAARSLFKLMAYKDEYEVARLFSNGVFRDQLKKHFGDDMKLTYHLAPPIFSRHDPDTGRPGKRRFPGFTRFIFNGLARFKWLRGSPFDPFGYTAERRMERQLVDEHIEMLMQVSRELTMSNYAVAVELAALPMQVRGFGPVKTASIAQIARRRSHLLSQFRGQLIPLFKAAQVTA
jgi:indolepyruvate ferredoxin oxidoreductase